jgi:hypothetical protein
VANEKQRLKNPMISARLTGHSLRQMQEERSPNRPTVLT